LHLTCWDEKAYQGEYGETMESAYSVLVATDGAKGSYYMKSALKLGVSLVSTEDIVRNCA
jgi:predicted aconitase